MDLGQQRRPSDYNMAGSDTSSDPGTIITAHPEETVMLMSDASSELFRPDRHDYEQHFGQVVPVESHLDVDDHSGEIDRQYTGVFEGPEKTLEVMFRKMDCDGAVLVEQVAAGQQQQQRLGLRQLDRRDLDLICSRAHCTIMSCVSNQYLDAYVLSESSLFVYPHMVVLKTCGTTTLLRCITTLIELGKRLGLEIDWVGYSRKNFNYPGDQQFPHQSFTQELDYLYSHRNLRLDGNGYTLGPITSDHWFVFVADQTIRSKSLDSDTDRVLNIMMFDIDETVAELFYYDAYKSNAYYPGEEETQAEAVKRISFAQTKAAGIDALCPGAIMDPRAFEPCGYSMNAILFRSYSTMHITPEKGSSYASFETNQRVASYKALINNVVRTFRPKRFVMTLMADEGGLKQMKENPLTGSSAAAKIVVPRATTTTAGGGKASPPAGAGKQMLYRRRSLASIKVEDDTCCMMGNWVLEEAPQEEHVNTVVRATRLRGLSVS